MLFLLAALAAASAPADFQAEPTDGGDGKPPAPPDPLLCGNVRVDLIDPPALRRMEGMGTQIALHHAPAVDLPAVELPSGGHICTRTGCGAPGTWKPVLMMMGLKWRGPFPLPLDIHVCGAHKAELEPQLLSKKTWDNGITPMWNEMMKRQGLQVGKHKPARHLLKITWEEVAQPSPAMSRPPAPPVDIRPEPTLDVELGMHNEPPLTGLEAPALPIGMEPGDTCNRTHDGDGVQLYDDGSPCPGILREKDVSDICDCFDNPPCDAHSRPLPVECPACFFLLEGD